MTTPEPPTKRRASPFSRLRAAADRVPTKWFAAIGTGLFLAATAAFGGLATVAAEPVPELEVGETHIGPLYALSVDRAFLFDELAEAGAYPAEGQRVLALRITVENVWTSPEGVSGMRETLSVAVPGAELTSMARIDDATTNPRLQPGVPAELAVAWLVPDDALAGGDEVTVTVSDPTLRTGQAVTSGQWWDDPVPSARVTLPVEYRPGDE